MRPYIAGGQRWVIAGGRAADGLPSPAARGGSSPAAPRRVVAGGTQAGHPPAAHGGTPSGGPRRDTLNVDVNLLVTITMNEQGRLPVSRGQMQELEVAGACSSPACQPD
jgi:hypothetical protein